MGLLGLDDEDFWSDPFRHRAAVIARLDGLPVDDDDAPAPAPSDEALDDAWMASVAAFAAEHPEAGEAAPEGGDTGIFLDGPGAVRNDLRDDVPLAGVRRYTGSVAAAQRFRERATLVVVRLASNEVFAGRLFAWKEPADSPPTPPPDASEESDTLREPLVTDFFVVRVRERIAGFSMRASPVRAVVLCGDERSNAVTVSVDDAPERDEAVAAFIAANRSPGFPRAISPARIAGAPLPTYLRTAQSPDDPSYGIALAAPSQVRSGGPCVVHASFALPVLDREVVRPFDATQDRFARLVGAPWVDVGDRDATAVLAIHLLLVGDALVEPVVLRLDVPVYGALAPVARGHFAVDLGAHPAMVRVAGRYALWAASGEVLVGPHALEITT